MTSPMHERVAAELLDRACPWPGIAAGSLCAARGRRLTRPVEHALRAQSAGFAARHRGGAAAGRRGHARGWRTARASCRCARRAAPAQVDQRRLRGADRALLAGRARARRRAVDRRCARPRPRCATPAATLIGAGMHPDRAVRRRRARRRRALRGDPRRRCAGCSSARRPRRCTSTSACPTRRRRSTPCNRLRAHLPLLQALAAHSPYWHGRDSGFATRPRDSCSAASRARSIPPAFAGWDHYAERRRAGAAAGRRRRLHVPVVGHAPEPAARHGRGARDGRADAGRARSPGSPRSSTRSRSPAPTATSEIEPPPEALTESSFRAGRDGARRDDLVARRACARCARSPPTRSSSRAPTRATSTARTRSSEVERILREGGGADRMRAAHAAGGMDERARPARAPRPTARPRPRRRSAASRRSPAAFGIGTRRQPWLAL